MPREAAYDQALIAACNHGDVALIQPLVTAGADVNTQNSDGTSPLATAVRHCHLTCVEALIRLRADVNQADQQGSSPLMEAIMQGEYTTNSTHSEFKSGAEVNTGSFPKRNTQLANCSNIYQNIVRLLINSGANVNATDCSCETALLKALHKGNLRSATYLTESGADVNINHKSLMAILVKASASGNTEIVRFILQSEVNMKAIDNCLSIALTKAAGEGYLEVVELLVKAGADVNFVCHENKSALMSASARGFLEVVKFLVSKGADVNSVPGCNQLSPLMLASCNGHVRTVQFLVSAGANVNIVRDNDRVTPLMLASCNDHLNIIKVLIEAGADVNSMDMKNQTALMKAATYGYVQSVQALVAAGADVNHTIPDGCSVLMCASSKGHVNCLHFLTQVEYIVYFEHYPFRRPIGSHQDRERFLKRRHCRRGMVHYSCPKKGLASIFDSNSKCIEFLVKAGADVNHCTDNGWTALHFSSLDGHVDIVRSLLSLEADVNARSAIDWTPLIAAIVGNHCQCAEALIGAGADVNVTVHVWHSTYWGTKTALRFALELNSIDIVKLLVHYGVRIDLFDIRSCASLGLRKLLRVAGDTTYCILDSEPKVQNANIEDEKRSKRHIWSLTEQCRRLIRRRLLEVNEKDNVFHMVRCLGLPVPLQDYLVFGVTLKC